MTRIVPALIVQLTLFTSPLFAAARQDDKPAARSGSVAQEPRAAQPQSEAAGKQVPPADAESRPPPPRRDQESRPLGKPIVIPMKNAECMEISDLLGRVLFKSQIVPVLRTNSIIYVGPEDTEAQVRALIAEIDRPVEEGHALEPTILPVLHRPVEEIADQVGKVLAGRDVSDFRMAADRGRSVLVVRGRKAIADAARSLVEQLDKPAGTVVIEFAFFHADLNRDTPLGKIPPDLRPVAEELGGRFGALDLLGLLSTVAIEGEKFTVEGELADISEARVQGNLTSASSDGMVRMGIGAFMRFETPAAGNAQAVGNKEGASASGPRPAFELQTVVQTKRGDYVVVGSAPTGWAAGESVILVLHVRS